MIGDYSSSRIVPSTGLVTEDLRRYLNEILDDPDEHAVFSALSGLSLGAGTSSVDNFGAKKRCRFGQQRASFSAYDIDRFNVATYFMVLPADGFYEFKIVGTVTLASLAVAEQAGIDIRDVSSNLIAYIQLDDTSRDPAELYALMPEFEEVLEYWDSDEEITYMCLPEQEGMIREILPEGRELIVV